MKNKIITEKINQENINCGNVICKRTNLSGMTLVEVTIFSVLLSLLIANTINYLYSIQVNNMKLINEIHDAQKGFMATTAIVILATGALVFQLVTLSAAVSYSDSITRREWRIQRGLNQKACEETLPLIVAKDYFLNEPVRLRDFDCVITRK